MEKYIVDTNILLDYPQIIDIKNVEIIIPTCVLKELDGLKRNQNNDTAFNARCGEGTRIFFDGDIKQADSQLFRNKNGLKLLLGLRKSPIYSKMFATIKLTMTERSKTAQCAEFLDDLSNKM